MILTLVAITPLKTMANDNWGEVTISKGEQIRLTLSTTVTELDKLSTVRFKSCSWESESGSVEIVTSNRYGCMVKGISECSKVKVWCEYTYEIDGTYAWTKKTINGYFLVTVV